MKIWSIEVFAFKYDHHYRLGGHTEMPNRLPGTDYYFEPQWQHAYSGQTESCLVKITTDSGLVGWGEGQSPLVPEVPATLIEKLLGPAIIGMDPLNTEAIYERLYHLNFVRGHTTSYTIDAITAIDIALWDIRGKFEGKPVSQISGKPRRAELPLYISGLRRKHLKERVELAREVINQGYRGVKIFKGDPVPEAVKEIETIRLAIGDEAELSFDAICRYDLREAILLGKALDRACAHWFESPTDPENIEAHAAISKAITTPVAVGEPLRTLREFKPWLEQEAMQIAQPDIVRCGITGGKRIIQAAEAKGLRVALHIGVCTAIGIAATWHMAASIEQSLAQEHQLDLFETANRVLQAPLITREGRAIIPSSAGLGIEVDEDFIRANSSEMRRIT